MLEIFEDPVLIQEKADGSQLSASVIDGELVVRSRGVHFSPYAAGDFQPACDYLLSIQDRLRPDWIYRCEYFRRPKQNALMYNRLPRNHLVLFDIEDGMQRFLPPLDVQREAERIEVEPWPPLFYGRWLKGALGLGDLLKESALGGPTMEGVVCKNYSRYGADKKVLMAKFVREDFKEINAKNWKAANPTGKDILLMLGDTYRTEARWRKAIQHLRDDGKLQGAVQDIGLIVREIWPDILKEHKEDILEALWRWAEPALRRIVVRGVPEFYKAELARSADERGGMAQEEDARGAVRGA